jgi:hypothetical protein
VKIGVQYFTVKRQGNSEKSPGSRSHKFLYYKLRSFHSSLSQPHKPVLQSEVLVHELCNYKIQREAYRRPSISKTNSSTASIQLRRSNPISINSILSTISKIEIQFADSYGPLVNEKLLSMRSCCGPPVNAKLSSTIHPSTFNPTTHLNDDQPLSIRAFSSLFEDRMNFSESPKPIDKANNRFRVEAPCSSRTPSLLPQAQDKPRR